MVLWLIAYFRRGAHPWLGMLGDAMWLYQCMRRIVMTFRQELMGFIDEVIFYFNFSNRPDAAWS